MLNPIFQNRQYIAVYFALWILVSAIHFSALHLIIGIEMYPALADSVFYSAFYSLLGLSFWYITKYISLEDNRPFRLVGNHLAAAIVSSAIWVIGGYYVLQRITESDLIYSEFLFSSLIWRFFIGILFYTIINALNYTLMYYANFREKLLKETELSSLVQEAELKTLKYQINPHFIFNSLNSISSLTISEPKKAQEMTIKLSSFLRSTLSKNEKQLTKLKDELHNTRVYLDIEKIRFEDKFEFRENVKDEFLNQEIPSMLLQPIFENAIKHGVYESIEKVLISIEAEIERDYLKLTIKNNYDPEAVAKSGEGIGLKNISKRLQLMYNQENLITTSKNGGIFTVKIYIPLSNGVKDGKN